MPTHHFFIKDNKGNLYHLLESVNNPAWIDVLAVEEKRSPDGTLQSVHNHRTKSYYNRLEELKAEFAGVAWVEVVKP